MSTTTTIQITTKPTKPSKISKVAKYLKSKVRHTYTMIYTHRNTINSYIIQVLRYIYVNSVVYKYIFTLEKETRKIQSENQNKKLPIFPSFS